MQHRGFYGFFDRILIGGFKQWPVISGMSMKFGTIMSNRTIL